MADTNAAPFSLRCFLGIHHWTAWSEVYRASYTTADGEVCDNVKAQARHCANCNRREARKAV